MSRDAEAFRLSFESQENLSMKRFCAIALLASLVPTSAFAGEGLLASGSRHVQQLASVPAEATAPSSTPAGKGTQPAAAYQAQGGSLARSGMSKGKKALIYIGLAAVAVGGIMTIDKNVLDVTPSSLGTRQD
jgi:hypothetical protein